jgi:hypothetical protein
MSEPIRLASVDGMHIVLDRRCPNANEWGHDQHCRYCHGAGFELTLEGEALLEFIERHRPTWGQEQ